jgi:Bacterial Ig-like domain
VSWNGHGENGQGGWDGDPEVSWIFPDQPELQETAHLLQLGHRREPPLDPAFRAALRRRLMQEAWERAAPTLPWWRRLLAPRAMAWAGATVGMVLIAVVVYTLTVTPAQPDSRVVVTSPLQGSQAVAATRPIELKFSQAMDTSSVEGSIQIQPATKVKTYRWVDDSTVQIVPQNGLAPNTQYHVSVNPTAKAQSGTAVVQQPTVTFVTAPPPTPRPASSPAATPQPTPAPGITTPREIAPSGSPSPAWSLDGSSLYVIGRGGQLQRFPVASGPARSIAPAGVTVVTVGPDGMVAYARDGEVVDGQTSIPNVQALALGFQDGKLLALAGRQVQTLGGSSQGPGTPSTAEDASQADFSENGHSLAYLGSSGLHLLDLTTGHDTAVGPASGLGAWSKEGTRYAYPAADGVYVTDGSGPGTKRISLPGAASVSWSSANQLLLTTQQPALLISNADGTGLRTLATGSFGHATWSPATGDMSFWFKRGGSVWVASVNPLASPSTATSSDGLVNQFMTARQQGNDALANSLLDEKGKEAFSGTKLMYGGGALSRYYVLLSQPKEAVVRMILNGGQTALDETLKVVRDSSSGRLMIDDVTESPVTLSTGPSILHVTVTAARVSVTFDSDLDPDTVRGVTISDVQSTVSYDPAKRTVVLTPEGGLTPGATYQVTVTSSLKDVNNWPAANYNLTLTGPIP